MKTNQWDSKEPCPDCGRPVAAGEGEILTRRDPATFEVTRVIRHRDCSAAGDQPSGERPLWAVYGKGRTPEGNETQGVRLVTADRPPNPDAVPANDAARMLTSSRPGDPHVAAQWLAYQQLRGIRSAGFTVDQLGDVLEGADLAAMDAAVDSSRRAG